MNKQDTANNWFTTLYSNAELAQILSDYTKDVYGQRPVLGGTLGRCTLVNRLEQLDNAVAAMPRAQRMGLGFLA
jgi:hypothetical protein